MNKFKKDDKVIITSGKDKGKSGKVLKVFPKLKKIVVEKVNIVKKHTKKTKENNGGILEVNKPFDWSKAKIVCPHSNTPTRVQFETIKNKKIRKSVKSKELIDKA